MKNFGRKNFKQKLSMTVMLIAAALCVTACGEEAETSTEELVEASSVESSSDEPGAQDSTEEESQPAEETEGSEGEAPQSAEEEEEEEAVISWIFSDMPVAAYEVTGLGIGRFEEVGGIYVGMDAECNIVEVSDPDDEDIDEDIYVLYVDSLVRLTPGENTFVLFCIQGEEEKEGAYWLSTATIHSPSGSSQWEAITYETSEMYFGTLGDFSELIRKETKYTDYFTYAYDEETYGGSFIGQMDTHGWFELAEIYHPDAPQNDAICVIEPIAYTGYKDMDGILADMVKTFEYIGATSVKEIPVEEALERCNVVVSEE